MLNLDPAKLVVILVLALVVMGPEKLQSSARHFGALFRSLTEFREKAEQQVRDAIPDLDLPRIPTSPRGAVTSYVSGLFTTAPGATSQSEVEVAPGFDEGRTETGSGIRRRENVPVSVPVVQHDDVSMN